MQATKLIIVEITKLLLSIVIRLTTRIRVYMFNIDYAESNLF